MSLKLGKVVNIQEVTDYDEILGDLEIEPHKKMKFLLEEVMEHFKGQPVTEAMKNAIKKHIVSIYEYYVDYKIFPQVLWDLDNDVVLDFEGSTLNIRIPRWIDHWMHTGEFMEASEVERYLARSEA